MGVRAPSRPSVAGQFAIASGSFRSSKPNVSLRQCQLFPLVQENIAPQTRQQQHGEPAGLGAALRRRPARHRSRRVVIRKCPTGPTHAFHVRPRAQRRSNQLRGQLVRVQKVESIRGMKTRIAGGQQLHLRFAAFAADLRDRESSAVLIRDLPDSLDEPRQVRMRPIVERLLIVDRPRTRPLALRAPADCRAADRRAARN